MKKAAGFTLIELLLVLVLIGIGTSLAIVSVNQLAERTEEQRWIDRTLQELRRLRNKAVLGGKPIVAMLDFEQGTISSTSAVGFSLPIRYRFIQATSIYNHPTTPLRLVFFPDGTMENAHFLLMMPSGQRQGFRLEKISGRIERFQIAAAS